MAREIPVYLFTGFLESGKTRVIQETMEDERFNTGEKTLILLCEEGIEELDVSRFYGKNVYLETIDAEQNLTEAFFKDCEKKHRLDRVLIEYNGMWKLETLFRALPQNFFLFQNMMFADASTFLSYNQNLRSLTVDKLTYAEMVIFNRPPKDLDKLLFHKIVRASSRRAEIVYEYPDGKMEYDEIEDPLPFDKEADVIEIADIDYALFYRDLSEDLEGYDGKVVKFKGQVARDPRLAANTMIAGRYIMTCCEADISFNGMVCIFDELKKLPIENRDWIVLTARVVIEKHKLYKEKGPVLYGISYAATTKPAQEVATFF